MKMTLAITCLLLLKKPEKYKWLMLIFFQIACNNSNDKMSPDQGAKENYKSKLSEARIPKTDFTISLPPDYTISETPGEDFSVYYFTHTDTTLENALRGGIYFGNFPKEFDADEGCSTLTQTSKLLKRDTEWTIHKCNERYVIQAITETNSGEGWNERTHAFGTGFSETDVQNLLDIFSTLTKK
jgi:hypothetical protein